MNIFVAGASGAIGRRLVPMLVARGHEVAAMTRSPEKARGLAELGAKPVLGDGLDRSSMLEVVLRAEPEVVVHQMTALAGVTSIRKLDDELEPTNRLRTEGTDNLLAAARRAGARRIIAQSYAMLTGGRIDAELPVTMRRSLAALRHVESVVPQADGIEGLVLRYGFFYGPGTGIAAGGPLVELVRKRKWPIIGAGDGVWSFVHVDDAASATLAAIERGEPGVYDVADDEPAPVRIWLPQLAEAVGARPPRRVSEWLGRLAAGEAGVYFATRVLGVSNEQAKRELGWRPGYPSWRAGFRYGLGDTPIELARVA